MVSELCNVPERRRSGSISRSSTFRRAASADAGSGSGSSATSYVSSRSASSRSVVGQDMAYRGRGDSRRVTALMTRASVRPGAADVRPARRECRPLWPGRRRRCHRCIGEASSQVPHRQSESCAMDGRLECVGPSDGSASSEVCVIGADAIVTETVVEQLVQARARRDAFAAAARHCVHSDVRGVAARAERGRCSSRHFGWSNTTTPSR